MFDSLIRSPGRLLERLLYNTTLGSIHQVQRRGNTGSPSAHARLSLPGVNALLTLIQGYSMVHYDISSACRFFTFMHVLASWYGRER